MHGAPGHREAAHDLTGDRCLDILPRSSRDPTSKKNPITACGRNRFCVSCAAELVRGSRKAGVSRGRNTLGESKGRSRGNVKALDSTSVIRKSIRLPSARVAELADALDLGSSTERCGGSNPPLRTIFPAVQGPGARRTPRHDIFVVENSPPWLAVSACQLVLPGGESDDHGRYRAYCRPGSPGMFRINPGGSSRRCRRPCPRAAIQAGSGTR